MPLTVRDVMSSPVITIDQEKSVRTAAEVIANARVGCLVVVKENVPVGIVTKTDLVRKVVARDLKGSNVKVKEIMSSPLITVKPSDDILVAVERIKRNKIHRLVVVEKGKVVGIVSVGDIAVTSPEMLELLEYRLKLREMEAPKITERFLSGICEVCGNYSDRLINYNGQWICEECKEAFAEEE